MNLLRTLSNCCQPTCRTIQTVNVPGPEGPQGDPCDPCSDGLNAFTTIEDVVPEVMPAVGSTVTVTVASSAWMVAQGVASTGQIVVVGPPDGPGIATFIGYMRVISIPDDTHVELENLGYSPNAAPGTNIAQGLKVSPAGLKGLDAAATGVYDTQAITNGVSSQVFTHTLGVVPTALICTVHKPSGGMNIFATVHSLTAANFTADFSGVIPAAGYSVEFVAFP